MSFLCLSGLPGLVKPETVLRGSRIGLVMPTMVQDGEAFPMF